MSHAAEALAGQEFAHDLPATPFDPALAAGRAGKIKVATIGLCGCWGCTLSLLDLDERLMPLMSKITLTRSSITDVKRINERCVVGFVEGGVANEENIETLEHFRENCDILISVGACAVWGGVPAMRNVVELKDCLTEAYVDSVTAVPGAKAVIPLHPDLPRITTKVYPCHEVVKMDYFIPGCPPSGDAIWTVLSDLLAGREPELGHGLLHYD